VNLTPTTPDINKVTGLETHLEFELEGKKVSIRSLASGDRCSHCSFYEGKCLLWLPRQYSLDFSFYKKIEEACVKLGTAVGRGYIFPCNSYRFNSISELIFFQVRKIPEIKEQIPLFGTEE